jgi:DNA-3-methyladenine glycosylase II
MTEAIRHLSGCDKAIAKLIARTGPCRMGVQRRRSPYEALLRAISHQQLHARAAEAILGRMLALHSGPGFPGPEAVLRMKETTLRACGFSASKIAAIQDLCDKTIAGIVPTRRTALRLDDEELIERLTEVRGIGRWTVEMLLIFTLGRPDVLPVDDYGVRKGFARMRKLAELPKPKELMAYGERWRPYRSVASWYMWRAAEMKALPLAGSAVKKPSVTAKVQPPPGRKMPLKSAQRSAARS